MRLSEKEKLIIINTAKEIFGDDAKIYLFGSRVYDDKRGGDIDILVKTNTRVSIDDKLTFLVKLQLKGRERKVDLLVKTPYSMDKNIYKTAKEQGILLC